MGRKDAVKLTKRVVDALSVEKRDRLFWDPDLTGFGVRVHATGRKVYVAQARPPGGGPKRVSVGRHGEFSPEKARRTAAGIIDRIRRGEDAVPPPESPEPTVADLAARYLAAHVAANCRPRTAETVERTVRLHILPELGGLGLSAVGRRHVSALHHKLRDRPFEANRTVGMLARMFRLAVAWGMTPARPNPCRSVRRYRVRDRERFLTPEEYRRLGAVLDEAEAEGSVWPSSVAALRLLLLTGCRKNEILALQWDDVDRTAGELRLRDSKTGARGVPLTPAVEWVLGGIPRIGDNPWIVTGRKPGSRLKGLDAIWVRLRARAGLEDVRLHDLRHSYASRALALGESLSMIGELLGHRAIATTARYAHLARDSEKAAAAKVGDSIGGDLLAA
ncbi:MAG: tyrosine-type recombinase/integrase [Rhodospirillaceae bacterium]|nr:tyrosine-type recombinase/integrase [Rhodospirillaceae bacterium]